MALWWLYGITLKKSFVEELKKNKYVDEILWKT